MQSRKLEDQLAALSAVTPDSDDGVAALRKALRSKTSHLAAKAATIIAQHEAEGFADDLVAAFDRYMQAGTKSDKGCFAKAAIAEALYKLGAREAHVYLAGIRHVQKEPVWGGQADTAIDLRGTCALALVRINYPQVMLELADLLADAEPPARTAAAKAIAYSERPDGLPLLRLKVRMGDAEQTVLAECFAAMMSLSPDDALDVVADYLDDADAMTAECAAIALGRSRSPAALAPLTAYFERTLDGERRQVALTAIAMLRVDASLDYLIELIADALPAVGEQAAQALGMYAFDPALVVRVKDAANQRDDGALDRIVAETFG